MDVDAIDVDAVYDLMEANQMSLGDIEMKKLIAANQMLVEGDEDNAGKSD